MNTFTQVPPSGASHAGSSADAARAAPAAPLDTGLACLVMLAQFHAVAGAVAPVVFTYTSFQAAAATATGGTFNMKCTNTMPYKLGFTNAPTPSATDVVTDDGVNLIYTLSLSAATGTGTGVDQPYTVSGSMGLGQIGNCLTATCSNGAATNKLRTLFVVY